MPLYLPGGGGSVEGITVTPGGDLQFNSGFGSVATAYGCRAWVNFNGTGTVAIRASGNVSSITDIGIGTYTINFTNPMPDTNFGVGLGWGNTQNGVVLREYSDIYARTTSSVTLVTASGVSPFSSLDFDTVCISIFR